MICPVLEILKKPEGLFPQAFCGERGIRTLGPTKQVNGFRDRPVRPLRHLSNFVANFAIGAAKVEILLMNPNMLQEKLAED